MLQRNEKFTKYCSLIGAHFIMAPLSFLWNYGNLSAYMDSYFQLYCAPDCVDFDSQWIINTFLACACPGVFLSWFILKKVGLKKAGIIIMFIANFALIASAWTLQVSIAGTVVLMGILNGMGMGPTVCIGFVYINGWAGKNSGLLIGTATSAPTILSIAQNQIITAYVNPKNLKADTLLGVRAFFSQREILERVPAIVLILGCMGLGFQMLGYFLVSDPPPADKDSSTEPDNKINGDLQNEKHKDADGYLANGVHQISFYELNSESAPVNTKEPIKHYLSNTNDSDNVNKVDLEQKTLQKNHFIVNSEMKSDTVRSYTPLEILQSGDFYALWLFGVALGFGLILKNNYYKQFGLLYINNDLFLTLVGSLIPVFASTARVIFGACIDRNILSIQDCLVISLAANSFLCAFWFFAPQINNILYMFLILFMACSHAMVHTIVGTGVAKVFGPEHYYINYGLVYSGSFVSAILSAFVVTPLRHALGWFWLFASCSFLSALVLVYTAFYKLRSTI